MPRALAKIVLKSWPTFFLLENLQTLGEILYLCRSYHPTRDRLKSFGTLRGNIAIANKLFRIINL